MEMYIKDDLRVDGLITGEFASYTHTQSTNATTWDVVHNLNKKYVNVVVFDSLNNQISGDINYMTVNNLQIVYDTAIKGKAEISI